MKLGIPPRPDTLGKDAVAGLVLGVESVPDGLAAGLLAGVSPLAGLYAYLFGTIGGSLFTSSAFMAVQATGAMAIVVADVPAVHSASDLARALFTLSMLTGVVMLAARWGWCWRSSWLRPPWPCWDGMAWRRSAISARSPGALPLPEAPILRLVPSLLIPAVSLAFVGLIQGAAISASFPNPDGGYPNASRDFIGQGAANVIAGIFRGMPVGGSMSATSLNKSAGARSRLALMIAGVVMAVVIFAFASLVGHIAMPALAGLLMLVGFRTIKPDDLRSVWKTGTVQKTVLATTFALTMVIPLQYTVLAGVGLSAILHAPTQTQQHGLNSSSAPPGPMRGEPRGTDGGWRRTRAEWWTGRTTQLGGCQGHGLRRILRCGASCIRPRSGRPAGPGWALGMGSGLRRKCVQG